MTPLSNEQIYSQWQYVPESLGSLGGRLISAGVVATSPATRESLQGYLRDPIEVLRSLRIPPVQDVSWGFSNMQKPERTFLP